ncbi:MAG: SPOR domain-containing protein [Roseomonas sp.]|nr:SPOR domain-containing protein [Roseomonas sp.]
MSEAVVPRPSYRVEREGSSMPWRMLGIAGGVLLVVTLAAGGWWAFRSLGGSSSVPLVEADPRPFKIRPDDPGGLRVPNQSELILERPGQRAQQGQGPRTGQVAPGAEAPDLGGLRAAAQPPARPAPAPATPPVAAPAAAPPATSSVVVQPATPLAPPVPQASASAAPAAAPARPVGRVQVQLGALPTEEAARAEWNRLAARMPELFQGRSPQVVRLDRSEGQTPLFRLRTGGLADQDAAASFCEQVRARGGACVPIRS